jgi:SAM-dependent methyltransferase
MSIGPKFRVPEYYGWVLKHKKYFSKELNGYIKLPIEGYLTILPLIDRNGKILDLGMGNGMLLKYLTLFSGHALVPYGVEINKESFKQAIDIVLPEYGANFILGNVNEYDFKDGPFDIIIANPTYAYPDLREFTYKCYSNLNPNGRIIYIVQGDVLEHFKIKSLSEIRDFDEFNIRTSVGYDQVYGIIDKPGLPIVYSANI